MNEPQHKTGPRVQMPKEQPEPDIASPEPTPHTMDTAPKNGKMIALVREDGATVEGRWHRTRAYDAKQSKWVEDGFWKLMINGQRVPFEPVGWFAVP